MMTVEGRRRHDGAGGGCTSRVYFVDGFAVPDSFPVWDITTDMLEGIEVHVRPAIPPEFLQCGFPCGVVVLWTRRPTPAELEVPRWRKTLLGFGILGVGFALMFF